MKENIDDSTIYGKLVKDCKEIAFEIKSKVSSISSCEIPSHNECSPADNISSELENQLTDLRSLLAHIKDSIII